MEIISEVKGQHEAVEDLQWYYQYIQVTPVWDPNSTALLYKFDIPLLSDTPYLLFNVFTHPVPVSNSSYKILVDVEPTYVLNTESGRLSKATTCMGHNPLVCQPMVEFAPSTFECARGLITNQPKLSASCTVTVTKHQPLPEVTTIDVNQFVFTTWGSQLVVRCPARPPQLINLKTGAYNLSCSQACIIDSGDWSLKCIDQKQLHRRYSMPLINITSHFNFATAFNKTTLETCLPDLKLSSKLTPITSSIDQLLVPHLESSVTIERSIDIAGIISLVLITILAGSVIFLIVRAKKLGISLSSLAGRQVLTQILPVSQPICQPDPTIDHRYCMPTAPFTAPPPRRLWPALPPAETSLKTPARLPNEFTPLAFDQDNSSLD